MVAVGVFCLTLVPIASAGANGVYIGSEAGLAYVPPITVKAGPDGWRRDPSLGYAMLGQLGYAWKPLRTEAELGFSQPGGDMSLADAMLNVYYDLPGWGPLAPFFGLGGGMARVAEQKTVQPGVDLQLAGSETNMVGATQAIAGASYTLTKQLSVKADYRYFRTLDESLGLVSALGANTHQAKVTPEAHCLMLGVTFRFGGKWRKP